MADRRSSLLGLLRRATADLPGVTEKAMFGCPAFFANGTIFTLLWKEDRIAIKLKDAALYAKLLAHEGAHAWSPGARTMKSWVLVGPALETSNTLAPWLARAHAAAAIVKSASSPKKKKTSPGNPPH